MNMKTNTLLTSITGAAAIVYFAPPFIIGLFMALISIVSEASKYIEFSVIGLLLAASSAALGVGVFYNLLSKYQLMTSLKYNGFVLSAALFIGVFSDFQVEANNESTLQVAAIELFTILPYVVYAFAVLITIWTISLVYGCFKKKRLHKTCD